MVADSATRKFDDVLGTVAAVIAADVLLFADLGTAVSALAGIPVLLFAPGYLLSIVVFPRPMVDAATGDRSHALLSGRASKDWSFELVVRLLVAMVASMVTVFLLAMAIVVSSWPFTRAGFVAVLTVSVLVVAVLALGRRLRLPPADRYQPGLRASLARLGRDGADVPLRGLLLGLSILLAATTVGLAFTMDDGDGYTEFYLLNADDRSTDVPTDFTENESRPVVVGIENHQHRQVEYSVVVVIQRIDGDGSIANERRLDRFDVTLSPGESWEAERPVTPTLAGERLRLTYLLYEGSVPDDPTRANAAHSLHLWIDVDET
jgi:uncharacterized membrane protein